jgi:hypothetical protein
MIKKTNEVGSSAGRRTRKRGLSNIIGRVIGVFVGPPVILSAERTGIIDFLIPFIMTHAAKRDWVCQSSSYHCQALADC